MSDSYAIDTSSLATVNREMPRDIHISVWSAIEDLITDGRLFLPRDAYEELLRVDDGLSQWAKQFPGFVMEATLEEIALVQDMTVRFPGWVEDQHNAADPWLVAHCSHHGRTVVSQERAKGPGTEPRNMEIPNVTATYQVACINFNGLARAEGWTF